ncbi:MAG: dimethylamine monooxygenase subunit DmmA family protein [Aestuariivirga sp.]
MLVVGIKSRPVYKGLTIDIHSARHLFALEGEGAGALADQVKSMGKGFLAKAEILYVGSEPETEKLRALKPFDFWTAPTIPVLLNRLKVALQAARMGTRLYISGTEGFIGQAMQVALDLGIDFNSIRTEHRGSTARRVQCVHCKGITDNVTTSPFTCSHCGLPLLVRDHYSRRLGAFQGVNIDAEDPGSAPKPEVLFP